MGGGVLVFEVVSNETATVEVPAQLFLMRSRTTRTDHMTPRGNRSIS